MLPREKIQSHEKRLDQTKGYIATPLCRVNLSTFPGVDEHLPVQILLARRYALQLKFRNW
jgi:hypothetical protein